MLKWFKPTWMVDSIYQIEPSELKRYGIQLVLVDLDNTLIAWDYPEATKESIQWINAVKDEEIEVVIISNNSKKRVMKVASVLGLPFIPNASKPSVKGFQEVMARHAVTRSELVMVGDQLLTDVLGANRAGIRSVLVKPILDSDAWNTKINRAIEKFLMKRLMKKYQDVEWRDSLDHPISKG